MVKILSILGAPVWLSRLNIKHRLRSRSHGRWVRAPRRGLCWQLGAWSLLQILCLPLSLPLPHSCSVSLCLRNKWTLKCSLCPHAFTNLLYKLVDFRYIQCIVIQYLDAQIILEFSKGSSFQLAPGSFCPVSIILCECLHFLAHWDAPAASSSPPVPTWNKEFLRWNLIPSFYETF